jgi:hypothetical protein
MPVCAGKPMTKTTTKQQANWRENAKTMDGLRRRYSGLHPLVFQRSIERATSAGDAFDILEGVPAVFPIMWDDYDRKWVTPKDMWLEPKIKAK